MSHTIEPAASGRSKCRGCKQSIAKGELRFGERLPNPFADGDMTIWFHVICAAYRRPESVAEVIDEFASELRAVVDFGIKHRRLPRLTGVGRAPSGRARCRSCREPIASGEFRIGLEFFEEGMFNPAGYIHIGCATDYFETADILARLIHFSPELTPDDADDLASQLK